MTAVSSQENRFYSTSKFYQIQLKISPEKKNIGFKTAILSYLQALDMGFNPTFNIADIRFILENLDCYFLIV